MGGGEPPGSRSQQQQQQQQQAAAAAEACSSSSSRSLQQKRQQQAAAAANDATHRYCDSGTVTSDVYGVRGVDAPAHSSLRSRQPNSNPTTSCCTIPVSSPCHHNIRSSLLTQLEHARLFPAVRQRTGDYLISAPRLTNRPLPAPRRHVTPRVNA